MSAADGIAAIASKQGVTDKSLDPAFHSNALGEVANECTKHWEKVEVSKTLPANDFRRIDGFPDDVTGSNITLTLLAPGGYSAGWSRDIYNDTALAHLIFVKDNLGADLVEGGIKPSNGVNVRVNESLDGFVIATIKGTTPSTLSDDAYGNFNANINASLPTNQYIISGVGSKFSGQSVLWILQDNTPYTFLKEVINTPVTYYESLTFYSDFDVTNPKVGQVLVRAGGNFGAAVAGGWKPISVTPRGDFATNPDLTMTTTPTILTGWTDEITPVGVAVNAEGEFSVVESGVYHTAIERIYQNNDNNPALLVNVSITVEKDEGQGWAAILNRTAPISSATAIDEPSILPFTTPSIEEMAAGAKFRILVSAEDGGASPQETIFIRSKVTIFKIAEL